MSLLPSFHAKAALIPPFSRYKLSQIPQHAGRFLVQGQQRPGESQTYRDDQGGGDYAGYDAHCVKAKSDARDAGVVFRYLRGELHGSILDMAYTDASALYEAPDPTWVAAPLVECRRA